ncbi:tRNA (adenosine(37)-N6)-threonylcarbamoyltransferase complex transferase subunit TsaD [Perlabentimonas gracilis]|uniref:tRNA (adenosine(37)-N6)-threonylcarbamoyltransferase complex transferase subunit TsaD n=1 Tax=Perlabentimonas gracilis TaxID=2715279 RepID=UPI001407F135|nr:tRNA (adenosine(37)-N6)-threonylcarbamoyltransferase complex transferase subunit TsaD [Perlabentimonas gracilis]NHB67815.1 tRNA (adenosine(37)-N6)-threonylcarbamoyltransferase complex transferase subunit TsaD [Perlabentimonas gracilis]
MSVIILGIESSCDDTSAAVIKDGWLLSNLISNQKVHEEYGGVVPELASRAHQANIIPVVDTAIKQAGLSPSDITAVAFTQGPGLLGSLLVGSSFAKGFALAQNIPLVEVNHLHGHILSHFIITSDRTKLPKFPFLCLLVSGGHTQLVLVSDFDRMEIIGKTIDDAAGEAFDKCAKVMGLGYPGGPVVDRLAAQGDPKAFKFAKPLPHGLDFSFSGLKTSFLYFLRDQLKDNPNFMEDRKADLCASLQHTIVTILMDKLIAAATNLGIKEIALAGGVAANSGLRTATLQAGERLGWNTYIPEFKFTTDNAAMIAIAGHYKYLRGEYADHSSVPKARLPF